MSRHLTLDGIYNIRDLGGYPTEAGGITNERVLIRSGNLDRVPASSQQHLLDYGVKTIVDLRDEWETQKYPNVFAHSQQMIYHNLPLVGNQLSNNSDWKTKTAAYELLHDLYFIYLQHCREQIGRIIVTISESPAGILFHCHAGKDRSGIIAGLLLSVAGVPDQGIAEDYAASYQQITHLIEQWRAYALQYGQDMQQFERDAASDAATMLNMLTSIQQHYGGVVQYLQGCGVTDQQISQLRSRFVQS